MAGDGYQNGGALIVGVNGETLFHYVQEGAPDHASNLDLLKVSVLLCIKNDKAIASDMLSAGLRVWGITAPFGCRGNMELGGGIYFCISLYIYFIDY